MTSRQGQGQGLSLLKMFNIMRFCGRTVVRLQNFQ
nr:MAG TPA: hypothetical protein [Caudoviricetes sp.]